MLGKIINEETGLCQVGLGTNIQFYKSLGMVIGIAIIIILI